MARDPNITFATKKIGINEEPVENNTSDSLLVWNPETGAIDQVAKSSIGTGLTATLQEVTDNGNTTNNEIVSTIPEGSEAQSYVSNSQFGQAYMGVNDEKPAFVALGNGSAAAVLAAGSLAITNNDNVTGVYSVNADGDPTFNGNPFGGGGGTQNLQQTLNNGSTATINTPFLVEQNTGADQTIINNQGGEVNVFGSQGVTLQSPNALGMYNQSGNGEVTISNTGISMDAATNGNVLIGATNGGAKYKEDYSADYTDRSLPDVGYVKQRVPYTGAEQDVDLGANNLRIGGNLNIGSNGYSYIELENNSYIEQDSGTLSVSNGAPTAAVVIAATNTLIRLDEQGVGIQTNAGTSYLRTDNINISRTHQLPNNDGVFAVSASVNGGAPVSVDENGNVNLIVATGGATNLSYTASPTQGQVNSDTGNDAIIPAGSTTNASLMLPADKTKLDALPATINGANTPITNTSFEVLNANNVQTAFEQTDLALQSARSTGVKFGGRATLTNSNTTVSFTAGSGEIMDNTDPSNPIYTVVNWSAFNNQAPAVTPGQTFWYINASGGLVQTTTVPTPADFRTRIYLARTTWTGTSISALATQVTPIQQTANNLRDFSMAIGVVKVSGSVPSASGANLKLKISAGQTYEYGANYNVSYTSPNIVSTNAFDSATGGTFRYATSTGAIPTDVTDINVGSYQNAGVVTAIPNNKPWGIHYIFGFPGGNVRVVYGTTTYSNITDASSAIINNDPYLAAPTTFRGASIVLGAVAALRTETNLNNATFFVTNKFGSFAGGATLSAVSLDLDSRPKIIKADVTDSPASSGTTEQILKSYLIPANTLSAGVLTTTFQADRVGGNATANFFVYTNSTNSLTGATLVARVSNTQGQLFQGFQRDFVIKTNNTLYAYGANSGAVSSYVSGTAASSTTAFNPTIDNYILFTILPTNAGDSFTIKTLDITFKKAQ